ncbi:predicted protein [Chaetomium globosum CBS 148.51]|uniref:Uncharacterized protein n=1 Tax=Chaetomium globosum (strain ATCC 6205 / CBS 148.51 / DSM 1962 / NBRC 6347 / NRRL 1970) TaxID=306901 RepID=Q2HEV2_CHAGB|nr:uncharacterized protein CHGG_01252 [Chaetomium globosum CBS 148.51]EAQ93017.1 predicted protein [Chaetomium globosum CBS 148.51]
MSAGAILPVRRSLPFEAFEPNLNTTSHPEQQFRIAMSANASSPWSGNHEPLRMDETGEAPPAYARVHRNNGRNPNLRQIATEGDFWMGLAELEPWMSYFGFRTMGPILAALFKRQNELERQRNALEQEIDMVSQLIRYLALNLQHPEEAAMHQNPVGEPREQWQQPQCRETIQRGGSPSRSQAFQQVAPPGTMGSGVAPLVGTTPRADIQDESAADPDIWQVVAPWGTAGVSHRNTHMG